MARAAFSVTGDRSSVKWRVKLSGAKKEDFRRGPEDEPKRPVHEPQADRIGSDLGNTAAGDFSRRKALEDALGESENRVRQSSQIILAHEGERKKLSRELKDSILSKLSAIQRGLDEKIALFGKDGSDERLELEKFKAASEEAIQDIKRIMTDLYPSFLVDLGLMAGLKYFLGEFQKSYSHVHITRDIRLQESDIPSPLGMVIFKVLQEALKNFIKHGRGDQVYASLKKKGGEIRLLIEDNGIGFAPENSKNGMGLNCMRGQVELSGGVFRLESAGGKGTTIRASWPC